MAALGQKTMAAKILNHLSWQSCTGVFHCIQFSTYRRELVLAEMSAAQALLLALYHSLLEEDLAHCSALIGVSRILEHLASPSVMVWLRDDFTFPTDDVTKVVRTLAHLKEKGLVTIPDNIIRVFVGLAKNYRVVTKCHDLQDEITLQLLSYYNELSTNEVGTMTNDSSPCVTDPREVEETNKIRGAVEMSSISVQIPHVHHNTTKNDKNVESDVNKTQQLTNVKPDSTAVSAEQNYTNLLTALHQAAHNGESTKLKELLSHGADPEGKERRHGNTAAHWAIKKDNVDTLHWLQRFGASLSERNYQGLTPLHLAAETGKTRTLIWLLDNGAYIDIIDDMHMTPLSRAASRGQVLAGRILVDRGASIDHYDENMRSPLHLAVLGGHHCMVRLLLERGADTSVRDRWSKTLLHAAVASGDLITFHFILKQKIDIDAKDNSGRTALHDASEVTNDWAVKLLLDKGANIEAKDEIGRTPLFGAALRCKEATKHLLQKGADTEAIDINGFTPADVAEASEVKMLLLSYDRTYLI
ncbi:serine/threonine-protein phosphatase 6 regulatory ankyrin repeat subunit A [Halyomorpha halys]|uniref:serine/threonine-protein phosphatase 6 regulatory ankyrin repeat subunit A n=1 Tax=Halyomorpha halys TaxID=286706 RepID=UPI0006D4EB54|nr:serine/threonine-protein phosphatase 6 regulatory ankyrin repeat subunit B-like [Halyomorpha halys]